MFRYFISIMMALMLMPAWGEAASIQLRWMAGVNGTLTDGTTTLLGPTAAGDAIIETLSNDAGGHYTSKTFTAKANPGYAFRNYSGTGGFVKRTANPVTVNFDGEDHDITANFTTKPLQFDLVTHGVPDIVDIQAGRSHTVVLKRNGTVVAWGNEVDGQADPELATLSGVTAIGVGPYTTFVVSNGVVKGYGMFADGNAVSNLPVKNYPPTPAPTNVVALASGLSHAVALKSDGSLVVWGSDNGWGQLDLPPELTGKKVTAIAAGHNFTLALTADGSVIGWGQGWGYNPSDKDGDGVKSGMPISTTANPIVAISAMAWHAMALYRDGTVYCWGQNDYGQTPTVLPAGVSNVKAIAAGGHHSIALKKDGTIVVWGGNPTNSGVPQGFVPAGATGGTLIAAGYYHSVAVTPSAILGWGINEAKQCEAPARAYNPITNGTLTCQTLDPYSTTVDFGSNSLCTIKPNPNLRTYFAVNGIQRSVAAGATTTTLTNMQEFQGVTGVFAVPPDAPAIAAATVSGGEATVTLTAPASDGGAPVVGYLVKTETPSVGVGVDKDAGTTSLIHTVTGLTSGTKYTFTATATNLIGTSGDSEQSKSPQTITIVTPAPASAPYNSTFTVAATAPGGGVSYSSAGGCSNVGPEFTMTSASVACTVKYDQEGSATYSPAGTSSVTLATKAEQAIQITKAAPLSARYGTSFTVAATAVGGEVSYSSAGSCGNIGPVFTINRSTGPCTVKYDQGGNADFGAAPELSSQTLATKGDQVITISTGKAAPVSAPFGSSFTVEASAPGGEVAYSSAGGCSNVNALFTMTNATLPCTVIYDQGGGDDYNAAPQLSSQTTVSKADQKIIVTAGKGAPASARFGTSFSVDATAVGGPITYSSAGGCSNVGAVFTMKSGTDACTVKYDQVGSANYNPAPQVISQSTATKADQTITMTAGKTAPSSAQFGASFTVEATAPGGALSYSSAGGCRNDGAVFTMTSATVTCTVKIDQGGDGNYTAAEVTSQTAATKADQGITVTPGKAAPASAQVGTVFTVDATAPGGAVTYSSAGGCSNAGAVFTITSANQCTVRYDQPGSSEYNAAPQVISVTNSSKAEQTITVTAGKAAPASAVFGSSFIVDATALGGAVSYSSAGGCSNVGPVFTMTSGTTACTVKYDQGGSANYNPAPQLTSQTAATKAEQGITITSAAPASATVGSSFTVVATAPAGTVTFSSSGGCTNSGSTFTMTTASSDCTVRYDQAGNADYAAAPQKSSSTTVVAAAPSLPGAPSAVTASAAINGQASVAFSAPASTGGSPISGFTVTANPGNITATGTGSPITVAGLSNGTAYTFTVTASNAAGTGSASAASAAVTPLPNGDLNGDGVVDLQDAMYALRLSIGSEPASNALLNRGDVAPLVNNKPKGDGRLDVGDVVVLLRRSVGLVTW
jgi:hypothetical protein